MCKFVCCASEARKLQLRYRQPGGIKIRCQIVGLFDPRTSQQEKNAFPPKCSVLLIPNFVYPKRARCRNASAPRKKREGEKGGPESKTGRTVDAPKSKADQSPSDRSIPVAMRFRPTWSDLPNPRSPSQETRPDQTRSDRIPLQTLPTPSKRSLALTRSRLTCSKLRARSAASTSNTPVTGAFLT